MADLVENYHLSTSFHGGGKPPKPPIPDSLSRGLSGLKFLLLVGGIVLAMLSGYLTGAYVTGGLISDGFGASDLLVGIGCGVACTALLIAYHYIGTHVLPFLPKDSRMGPVLAFCVTGVLIIALSTTSNFLQVTEAPVRVAEQNRLLDEVQADYHESAKAARELGVLIPITRSAADTTGGLLSDETSNGSVCLRGAGNGRCAAELRALYNQLNSTVASLIDAEASTTRLVRSGEDILADIQELRSVRDLAWAEKDVAVRRRLDDLGRIGDEINQSLPVSAVEALSDAFSKPWLQIGFTPQGAAKMAGTYTPIASRLRENTVQLRSVRHRQVTDTTRKTGLKAAFDHMDKVAVQACLALLIDVLPMVAIFILLIIQWGQSDRRGN